MTDHHYYSNFIWQIADLLRGPYRPAEYVRVMLPLTVLRRFDCVLEEKKPQVLIEYERLKSKLLEEKLDEQLNNIAEQRFHNHSESDFQSINLGDSRKSTSTLLHEYIDGFSANVRRIFDYFDFSVDIQKMADVNVLNLIIWKFCELDLHPNVVDTIDMGLIFEDIIRRFNEAANETAGDHFTPREVIHLMVDLIFKPDDSILAVSDKTFKLLDPTCGTGGMLAEAQNQFRKKKKANLWTSRIQVFGQDYNRRSYAIAASDLLMKGNENSAIRYGDSLTEDQYPVSDELTKGQFDYFLANPPFGVDWKRQQKIIQREHEKEGKQGRFGAGLPRVNDGALLFLQHMVSKFMPNEPQMKQFGSRLAIVFNGSPLFTGGAGSGESEIRKWLIEETDMLEAIIALPEQMFYNTSIGTYIWIVTNRKEEHRKRKIQLIDARARWKPMRRGLGNKRREMAKNDIDAVVGEYGNFVETETSKIFHNADFGYNRVPIERPLRLLYQMDVERKSRFLDALPHLLDDVQLIDREGGREPRDDWYSFEMWMTELLKRRGRRWKANERKLFRDVFADRSPDKEVLPIIIDERPKEEINHDRVWGWFDDDPRQLQKEVRYEPDTQLRDFENVVMKEAVERHVREQVLYHVDDAWADRPNIRSAYEINFNRYFYKYVPPRPLEAINADLRDLEVEMLRLLREMIS